MAETASLPKSRDMVFVVTQFCWDYKPGHCFGDTLGVFRSWSAAYECVIKALKESIRVYLEDDDEAVELPTPTTHDELSVFLRHPLQFAKDQPSETSSSLTAENGTVWTFEPDQELAFWTYDNDFYQIHKIQVTEAVAPGNKRQRQ